MRLAFALLILCAAMALDAAASAAQSGPESPLRLTEFLAGPARDWDQSGSFSSRDDEWVEVKNTGDDALDLSGYLISDGDSLPRFAFTGTLGGQERRVVFGRDSYAWERASGHPAFGLSLGNTGDAVLLWRVVEAETLLVDSYAYGSHEAAGDRAVGRLNDNGPWQLFDGLNPYTGTTPPQGNQCEPTPGALNLCGTTRVEPVTWGRLKALYR
jgi:hypothetical protein